MAKLFRLRVLNTAGILAETDCDSVQVTLADDSNGKGGGSYGIRAGHTPAVLVLGNGPVKAHKNGTVVYTGSFRGGFALIEKAVLTIVPDTE